jgi:hypothetical protein
MSAAFSRVGKIIALTTQYKLEIPGEKYWSGERIYTNDCRLQPCLPTHRLLHKDSAAFLACCKPKFLSWEHLELIFFLTCLIYGWLYLWIRNPHIWRVDCIYLKSSLRYLLKASITTILISLLPLFYIEPLR